MLRTALPRPLRALAALAVLAPALLTPFAPAAGAAELLVAAAASLREPAQEIAAAFEARRPGHRVRLAFGGTNVLAAQVRAGAPVDVLLSADERSVEELVALGRVPADAHFVLARNRLVVMQRAGLAPALREPADLTGEAVRRIAVPEHAVPVGRYARQWLERRGLLEALGPRLVPTENARATLAAVDHGHADAAIVYASDARVARSARLAFEIDPAEQPSIAYVAARVADARTPALADAFLAFLRGPETRAVLEGAGFAAPSGP